MTPDQILATTLDDISRADEYYDSIIEPKLKTRKQIYSADKSYYTSKYPRLSERTDIVSYDCWATVRWFATSCLKSFLGGDPRKVIGIQPVGAEDRHKSDRLRDLITFQLVSENKGYMVFFDWFLDAFAYNLGAIKCWWETKIEPEQEITEVMDLTRLQALQASREIQIASQEQLDAPDLMRVTYRRIVPVFNGPKLTLVRPTELRFFADARLDEDPSWIAHRVVVNADTLRRKAAIGIYDSQAVEEAITAGGTPEYTSLDLEYSDLQNDRPETHDARKKMILYECYSKLDVNDDGLLEDNLITVCNGKLLRCEDNPFHRHPFFFLVPFPDGFRLWSDLGLPEISGEIQDLQTALYRQLVINVALNNSPRVFLDDSRVNMDDYITGLEAIRVHGDPRGAVMSQPTQPIASWTMPFIESLNGLKEEWTGKTRYNQGTDATSLNHTATGIDLIFKASMSGMEAVASRFAETGVSDLIRFMVKLDQALVDQRLIFRLFGDQLEIDPTDLSGHYDVTISVTNGLVGQEQRIKLLETYMVHIFPQAMQLGLVGPENFLTAARMYLSESGLKDTDSLFGGGMQVGPSVPGAGGAGMPGSAQGVAGGPPQGVPQASVSRLPGGASGAPSGVAAPVQAGGGALGRGGNGQAGGNGQP